MQVELVIRSKIKVHKCCYVKAVNGIIKSKDYCMKCVAKHKYRRYLLVFEHLFKYYYKLLSYRFAIESFFSFIISYLFKKKYI